jgi:hypothetical protein
VQRLNEAHPGFMQSRSDRMTVALDFSPRIAKGDALVAERRLMALVVPGPFQASLRDVSRAFLNRGLKSTATIMASLREEGG